MSNLNAAFMNLVRSTDLEKIWSPEPPIFRGNLKIRIDGNTFLVKEGNWERISPVHIGIKNEEQCLILGKYVQAWIEPVDGVTTIEIGRKKFRFHLNTDANVKSLRVCCSEDKQITGFLLFDWESINKKNK